MTEVITFNGVPIHVCTEAEDRFGYISRGGVCPYCGKKPEAEAPEKPKAEA